MPGMNTKARKKYWLGFASLGAVLLVASFFFFPGFQGEAPPPETIGADVVQTGADFTRGEAQGTAVLTVPLAGDVLSLSPAGSQGSFTSPAIEADYDFNALGLHWAAQLPAGSSVKVEVRFSQDGRQWDEWRAVEEDADDLPDHIGQTKSAGESIGQLVFADRASFFQYRLQLSSSPSGAAPTVSKMTASYIDAHGYHEAPLSVTALANWAGWMLKPKIAEATPGIISRAQWGANEAYMNWTPEYVTPQKQVIHHTVTGNWEADPAATVRSIYYYHAVSLGWGDIGYNYLVDWHGNIYEGRYGGNGVVGGHAYGWNVGTIGIAALGTYDAADITNEAYWGFVNILTWTSNLNQINPYGYTPMNGTSLPNYVGHRDVGATGCPGGRLYARIPAFRADANAHYSPIPIVGAIRSKYYAVHALPGIPLGVEYPVYDAGHQWIGQAQDFQFGRIVWNKDTGAVFWIYGSILAKYDQLGREASFLGLPVSDEFGAGSGRAHDFAGGRIYWSSNTGPHVVYGGILAKLISLGDVMALGFPFTDEIDVAGHPGARESDFQFGRIYWSDIGGRAVYGAILNKYLQYGGPASLGLPGGEEADVAGRPGSRRQDFASSTIFWSNATGPHLLAGRMLAKHNALGGAAGFLALPATDQFTAGSGQAQGFQGGLMTDGSAAGTHVVFGSILAKYLQLGGPAGLGLATSDEIDAPGVSGGREGDFELGRIYWSQSTGPRMVVGAILAKYLSGGGSAVWGLPLTDEYAVAGVAGARESDFQHGRIYWSSATGTHLVYGAILGRYMQSGGAAVLGLPTTDEIDAGVAGAREGDFQRGRIYWSESSGARLVNGAILSKYLQAGGPTGTLGLPNTDEYDAPGVAGARESDFQHGRIYWSMSTDAHSISGAILDKWLTFGPSGGGMGLPVSDEFSIAGVAGAREHDFKGGRIYWSPATGAHAVYGGILSKYLTHGGPGSDLGLPTSEEYGSGTGRRNDFQGGFIYWDNSGGAQVFANSTSAATVSADGAFQVKDDNGSLLTTLAPGQTAAVSYAGGAYTVQANNGFSHTGSAPIRLSPINSGSIMQVASFHDVPSWDASLDDNRFRGTIEVRYSPVSNLLWVINELPLEMYLRGIAETSSGVPDEFLKTMVVAARSYALWQVNAGGKSYNGKQDIFHLKNSRNGNGDDQQYRGYGLESRFPSLTSAIAATAGQTITYNNAVALATYYSNSDGRTRSAQEVWGTSSWPWLASVSDPDCNGMAMAGHGVGLSGHGALKRAERGDGYQAILGYYYSGTAVQPQDSNKNIRVAIQHLP